jgi:probable rRNA maturation factor
MPRAESSGGDPGLDIQVNAGDFHQAPEVLIERAVRRAFDDAGSRGGEMSVTLLSDADIQALNREYLAKDRPTDVIAFSLGGPESILGDVYIGFERAVGQSSELGVALDEELARLAIHGALHLLGHDHPDGAERVDCPMFELQERLLREVLAEGGGC